MLLLWAIKAYGGFLVLFFLVVDLLVFFFPQGGLVCGFF